MELMIQDLVTSIRKEGIDAANTEAASILAEARKKADAMIADAKAEAKAVKEAAEKEIAVLKESAAISAEQARRDAVLSFKNEIKGEFEKLLAADVRKSLTDDALGKLIKGALDGEDVSKYVVEVAKVGESLKAQLAEKIKAGLEIKPTKGVQAGFRLAAKDGSGYFDCSDDEIMKMLMPYFRNLDF